MQSLETEADLVRFLMTLSRGELCAENQRLGLAQNERFEPYAAFQRLDQELSGTIGGDEIERFLRSVACDNYLIVIGDTM